VELNSAPLTKEPTMFHTARRRTPRSYDRQIARLLTASVVVSALLATTSSARGVSPSPAVAGTVVTITQPVVAVPLTPATGPQPYTGGQTAAPGEFAFVAGIRDLGASRFFCTGSLVDPQWILTAGHCVDGGKVAANLEVVIGDTDLNTATDPAETRLVDGIVIHPKWGGDAGDSHDVAMLHLTSPSTLQPIYFGVPKELKAGIKRCQTIRNSYVGPAAQVLRIMPCPIAVGTGVGWGRISGSSTTTSTTLKKATAKIFDMGPKTFWRAKSGACPGDSGGPLLVRNSDGELRQIGVASYNQHGNGTWDWLVGSRCSPRGYDFYSNVGAGELLSWFEGVMA
jgi:secreted trypsin-like serine protease